MGHNRYKIQTLSLFIATLLFMVLMAVSFWNASLKSDIPLGPWPSIFLISLILSMISASLFYIAYKRATDPKLVEEEINTQVNEVRAQLIEEMNKDKEKVEDQDKRLILESTINKIIPKGNFKNSESLIAKLLKNLADEFQIVCGIYYSFNKQKKVFSMQTSYALQSDAKVADFKTGENLNGQSAENQDIIIVNDIPEDYFTVESGLGKSLPRHLCLVPIVSDKKTIAVLEFATFIEMPERANEILSAVASHVGEKINSL